MLQKKSSFLCSGQPAIQSDENQRRLFTLLQCSDEC
jgi:hypothetical protein